jgi:hypothetical protein
MYFDFFLCLTHAKICWGSTTFKYLLIFNIKLHHACLFSMLYVVTVVSNLLFVSLFEMWSETKQKALLVSWWWCSIWRFRSSSVRRFFVSYMQLCAYKQGSFFSVCVIFVNFVIWLRSVKSERVERENERESEK